MRIRVKENVYQTAKMERQGSRTETAALILNFTQKETPYFAFCNKIANFAFCYK